jgi:glutathione S-transferase
MVEVPGRASSINVRKLLWTCAEIGIGIRHEQWGAGTLSLQHRAFNAPVRNSPAHGRNGVP